MNMLNTKITKNQLARNNLYNPLFLFFVESFKACELWVYESAVDKELSCCDFVFALLCSRGYKQITYDSKRCNHKGTDLNADATASTTSADSSTQ
uniref:Putative salivary lipocalin n=1 Tax=Ixodes ricinus TaxID=34613 RepID=A0A0K8RFJ8_IXORI